MHRDMGAEVAALRRLTVKGLRARYAEVFGEETPASNRAWLLKRVAWRLQSRAEGGLSERALGRVAELADEADLRMGPPVERRPRGARRADAAAAPAAPTAPAVEATTVAAEAALAPRLGVLTLPAPSAPQDHRLPAPGTVLTRKYKGEVLQVKVLQDGFEWRGEVYASLSAAARAITGSHLNGFAFFGLNKENGR